MKITEARGLQAFRRIDAWFVDHPQVVSNSGSSAPALASQVDALKAITDRMAQQATDQTNQQGQTKLASKDEASLKTDLRSLHMRAILRVARALKGKVPGMGAFKMPTPNTTSEALVRAGAALQAAAAPYKDVFVQRGLPHDFLDQLAASAAALKASIDARGVAKSKSTGATQGLASDLADGRSIVALIDASLSHALKSDPAALASWHSAKRLAVKPVSLGSPSGSTPPASGATSTRAGAPSTGTATTAPGTGANSAGATSAGATSVPVAAAPVSSTAGSATAGGGPVTPSVGAGSTAAAAIPNAA
jgi:hypothetical protein